MPPDIPHASTTKPCPNPPNSSKANPPPTRISPAPRTLLHHLLSPKAPPTTKPTHPSRQPRLLRPRPLGAPPPAVIIVVAHVRRGSSVVSRADGREAGRALLLWGLRVGLCWCLGVGLLLLLLLLWRRGGLRVEGLAGVRRRGCCVAGDCEDCWPWLTLALGRCWRQGRHAASVGLLRGLLLTAVVFRGAQVADGGSAACAPARCLGLWRLKWRLRLRLSLILLLLAVPPLTFQRGFFLVQAAEGDVVVVDADFYGHGR